jgi:hypothetical protein
MLGLVNRFAYGRNDADFPEAYRDDPNRPERISDHDLPVAFFQLPLDHTPPVLTLPSDITVDATSSTGAVVSFTATALDTNDGSTAVVCTPASGSQFPVGTNTVSCSSQDARHNSTNGQFHVTVKAVKVGDITPPMVNVTGVSQGANYILGAVPAAGCSTTDAGSGVAVNAELSLSGGTANHVGFFTATCSGGKDVAGNVAAPVSVSYTVSYRWHGFLSPEDHHNRFEAGDTIPILWRLSDTRRRKAGSLSSVTSLQVAANTDCTGAAEAKPFNPVSQGNKGLRYYSFFSVFEFEWKTKGLSEGCYSIVLSLDDGSKHSEVIKLRRDDDDHHHH